MKRALLLAFFFVPLFASAATFRISTEEYQPYIIVEQGKVSGAFIDLVNAALAQRGHKAVYEVVPWARAFDMAEKEPNGVTAPWFRTPEREKAFLFSDPVIRLPTVFLCLLRGKSPRTSTGSVSRISGRTSSAA